LKKNQSFAAILLVLYSHFVIWYKYRMNDKILNNSNPEPASLKSSTESEKLEAVLRYSPAIILTVDRQMRIQSINRVRAGLTVEDVLSTSCLDYVPHEHRARLETYIKKVFETGESISYEIQGRGDHDVLAWYSTRLSLLSKGTANEQVLFITEDITECKMAGEALNTSEKRYRTIVHNIPGMVYRAYNHEWKAEIISGAERICGYSEEEINSMPHGWLDIIHSKDRNMVVSNIAFLLKAPQMLIQVYRIIAKDGKIRWVEDRKTSVFTGTGSFESIDGIVLDITERKRLEAEIGLRSEILFQMAEGANMVRGSDSKIIFTNPAFDRMFGYGPGELIGKNISIVNAPTLKDPLVTANEIRKALASEGSWHGELQNVRKDGSTFWSAATVFSFDHREFGQVFISIHADITDRKRVETALRESEERFRSAIMGAPFPVIIHAEDGEILAVSNIVTTLTGYAHEDIRTMSMWTDKVFGQKSQEMYEFIQKLFERERIDEGGEHDITTKSGKILTWYFRANPLGKLPDGRKLLIAMALDITERKRMEDERVERKSAERAMNNVLMEIHDGIGGITTNITMLSEVAKKATRPEDAEKVLNTISDLARDGMVEIRSLMYSLDREDLNWRSLVVEMRNQGTKLLEPHAITFTMTSDIGDNIQNPGSHLCLNLFRIYREALMNVIKHARAMKVMASFHVDKERIVLTIQDDGKGFEQSALTGGGRGVSNMMARASAIHGKVAITGDRGTCVTIEMPVELKAISGQL